MLNAGFAAPTSWPLIGRDHELTRIAAARAEGAPAVAICAEAGIGKTHLARHALERAGQAGAFDAWVHVTRSSSSVPLAAFGELVPPGMSLENEAGFIQVLINVLREQAAGREIVVGVDNAQLLDPASATFLLHIAEHAVAFVIATIRPASHARTRSLRCGRTPALCAWTSTRSTTPSWRSSSRRCWTVRSSATRIFGSRKAAAATCSMHSSCSRARSKAKR